jgi:hypothetical protein
MRTQRIAGAVTLLGSWLLVQVPAKNMKLSDPGHPMAPIAQYTKIRVARAAALQDAMSEGSDAMAAQSSSLRCVKAEDLPTPAPTP